MTYSEFYNEVFDGWNEQNERDISKLRNVFEFAKKAHEGQLRDEGVPYFDHVIGAFKILKNEFMNKDYLDYQIMLLHDVVEDTDYTYEDIRNLFGVLVADGVNVLTKREGELVGDYIRRLKDYQFYHQLAVIKLADRLHNLRSLLNLSPGDEKVLRKLLETEKYYLPILRDLNEPIITDLFTKAISDLREFIDNK